MESACIKREKNTKNQMYMYIDRNQIRCLFRNGI